MDDDVAFQVGLTAKSIITVRKTPDVRRTWSDKKNYTSKKTQTKKVSWSVFAFLLSLFIPWIVPVGPMELSISRLVLLVALLPCFVMWVRGKAGPIRVADFGILMFCIWGAMSLIGAHGAAPAIEPAGILTIETMGAYLLARCFIRDAEDFRNMILIMARLVMFLLPFAIYEAVFGTKPLLVAFSSVLPTFEFVGTDFRWGFQRVQGPFSHPILFGLCCGSAVAMTHLVLGRDRTVPSRWLLTGTVAFTAALSLSSAPLAAVFFQIALLAWNWLLRDNASRWKLLCSLGLLAYLVVEFGSNQTPIQFYISRFTFDAETGWYRLAIWEYGSASVLNHPLFGIGLADYARPSWMQSTSVDNFWLLNAMRHGVPAIILLLGSFFWVMFAVSRKKGLDDKLQSYRIAYCLSMATFFFVGFTVHFWGPTYLWFMFLLGGGVWLLDAGSSGQSIGKSKEQLEGVRTGHHLTVKRTRRDNLT